MSVNHLSTPGDVLRFAIDGSHVVLWKCIQGHIHGILTWEQAMQAAAISQAEHVAALTKECVRLRSLLSEPTILKGAP